MLISIPEERWLLHSTHKLFRAFFGCVYLEQHIRLKRIVYSFVFVMLLKEKMRYWLKADYVKKPFFCHLQKLIIKMLYRHIIDLFYHSIIYLMCFSSASSRLDFFWRNVWKSISQENVFSNIELGKSLFAHNSLRTLHCVCDMNRISI